MLDISGRFAGLQALDALFCDARGFFIRQGTAEMYRKSFQHRHGISHRVIIRHHQHISFSPPRRPVFQGIFCISAPTNSQPLRLLIQPCAAVPYLMIKSREDRVRQKAIADNDADFRVQETGQFLLKPWCSFIKMSFSRHSPSRMQSTMRSLPTDGVFQSFCQAADGGSNRRIRLSIFWNMVVPLLGTPLLMTSTAPPLQLHKHALR